MPDFKDKLKTAIEQDNLNAVLNLCQEESKEEKIVPSTVETTLRDSKDEKITADTITPIKTKPYYPYYIALMEAIRLSNEEIALKLLEHIPENEEGNDLLINADAIFSMQTAHSLANDFKQYKVLKALHLRDWERLRSKDIYNLKDLDIAKESFSDLAPHNWDQAQAQFFITYLQSTTICDFLKIRLVAPKFQTSAYNAIFVLDKIASISAPGIDKTHTLLLQSLLGRLFELDALAFPANWNFSQMNSNIFFLLVNHPKIKDALNNTDSLTHLFATACKDAEFLPKLAYLLRTQNFNPNYIKAAFRYLPGTDAQHRYTMEVVAMVKPYLNKNNQAPLPEIDKELYELICTEDHHAIQEIFSKPTATFAPETLATLLRFYIAAPQMPQLKNKVPETTPEITTTKTENNQKALLSLNAPENNTILKEIIRKHAYHVLKTPNQEGKIPLHIAFANGQKEWILALLEYAPHTQLNVKDIHGKKPQDYWTGDKTWLRSHIKEWADKKADLLDTVFYFQKKYQEDGSDAAYHQRVTIQREYVAFQETNAAAESSPITEVKHSNTTIDDAKSKSLGESLQSWKKQVSSPFSERFAILLGKQKTAQRRSDLGAYWGFLKNQPSALPEKVHKDLTLLTEPAPTPTSK